MKDTALLVAAMLLADAATAAPRLKPPKDDWPKVGDVVYLGQLSFEVTEWDKGTDSFLVTNPRSRATRWFVRKDFQAKFRVVDAKR